MLKHELNDSDREFRKAFEAGAYAPADFSHRAHVRLAYAYLVDSDDDHAIGQMRSALRAFLAHHGIPATKYHETLTRAWVLAVRHFMQRTPEAASADDFIARNPLLLDSRIMLTHYSAELLFSESARTDFVAPDLDPIPRHASK
jgi:hypothetical protein